ncbi:MAG TPA: site-specific DNA-methyltransferase [Solirubrobacteraceae bacterium]|nr:site-specific DNA-methyltransferase [Solirubrobacteraceae bacterium]
MAVNVAPERHEPPVAEREVAIAPVEELSPTAIGADAVLIHGSARAALERLPDASVDCVLTSPPYWSVRKYDGGSALGEEATPQEYVEHLVDELEGLLRVVKPTGSFWLNIGDTYLRKNLCGIPWRAAFAFQDKGWILRNDVIWDKVKGNPDNARDKLRDLHEFVFHFARSRDYYYDVDAIRQPPVPPSFQKGVVVTPTGVSGVKYRRQISKSHALTADEKKAAIAALDEALNKVVDGSLPDFRMIIRGQQRTTHSDVTEVSGRANEIEKYGFCILPYHSKGSKPGDVWQIIPEDRWRVDSHCAVFPEELCRIPVLATAPKDGGVVLDPFVGTGTSVKVARDHGVRGIGIDTSLDYLQVARDRLAPESD